MTPCECACRCAPGASEQPPPWWYWIIFLVVLVAGAVYVRWFAREGDWYH